MKWTLNDSEALGQTDMHGAHKIASRIVKNSACAGTDQHAHEAAAARGDTAAVAQEEKHRQPPSAIIIMPSRARRKLKMLKWMQVTVVFFSTLLALIESVWVHDLNTRISQDITSLVRYLARESFHR